MLAKKISETNSKMCSRCPLSTCVPKIETIQFGIYFQFQTMTQHFLVRPLGKPTSPEIERERERKWKQFILHLYWLEYFSCYPKQSNIATLVKCSCKVVKLLSCLWTFNSHSFFLTLCAENILLLIFVINQYCLKLFSGLCKSSILFQTIP